MEKLKAIIKWIAVDELLHFLVCYAIMLAFMPMVGIWWTTAITLSTAIGKEVIDVLRAKNNKEQVIHDLVCDGLGMATAYLTIFLWWLCNL